MKTKRPLPKRFSGKLHASGILLGALALALVTASAASAKPFAYISNMLSGSVSVIDGVTLLVPPVPTGFLPGGVAVNPAGTFAYVANQGDGTVSVIRTSDHTVVGSPIAVGMNPWGVAVSGDNAKVYVGLGNGNVAVIDVNNGNHSLNPNPIPVGGNLNGIVVVGSQVYVSDASAGQVVTFDGSSANPTFTRINVGAGFNSLPMGIVASPQRQRVYVVDVRDNNVDGRILEVSAINTTNNTVAGTIMLEGPTQTNPDGTMASPGGIAISPDENRLYVTNDSLDLLYIVPLSGGSIAQVTVGATPIGVAIDPDGSRVYVANVSDGTVSVIDASSNAVLTTLTVGGQPFVFGAFATAGPPRYALTTTTVGAGTITADQAPVGGTYAADTVVTLRATAGPGFQFTGWSVDCSGFGACQVTMDGPRRVTATFTATPAPPPPAPVPPSCDAEITELQKKVSKLGRHHGPAWLKAALYARGAAEYELKLAYKKVGDKDSRYLRAMKEFKNGDAKLCAGRYWRAKHEYWDAFDIAHKILRNHRHGRR